MTLAYLDRVAMGAVEMGGASVPTAIALPAAETEAAPSTATSD